MPIIGERKTKTAKMGEGYRFDPIQEYAATFGSVAKNILQESAVDLFLEPNKALRSRTVNQTLQDFFVENSCDRNEFQNDTRAYDDHIEMMKEQYLNDKEAILEYAPMAAYNPVVGMTFPIHKRILMNTIFEKAIPKFVATSPKFTISMETRTLIGPDGQEVDMWRDQLKMKDLIDSTAPFVDVVVDLADEAFIDVDVTAKLGATPMINGSDINLDIATYVSAVGVEKTVVPGEIYYDQDEKKDKVADGSEGKKIVWFPVKKNFVVAYGEIDRQMMEPINFAIPTADGILQVNDVITGYMKKNKVTLLAAKGPSAGGISAIKLSAKVDTSTAMLKTCQVTWSVKTDLVEIPNAIPINTPVSPEEVKDIGALYQINQLTKLMSLFNITLGNYKDDKIKDNIDESFLTTPATDKFATAFDFNPPESYALDPVEWRYKTFMDYLDTQVSFLLQVIRDPNMTISILGRPDLIRKIKPTDPVYTSPSNIGPVQLDFTRTVVTDGNRVYNFISSDKLTNNNNLIILLAPRNSERIIYRIYDYQMYVSNEIRNAANYALPAIHAFERWKFVEYQPVQGRLRILNPLGYNREFVNDDPIGKTAMNDYTANLDETTRKAVEASLNGAEIKPNLYNTPASPILQGQSFTVPEAPYDPSQDTASDSDEQDG
jgi:hypothetical protein